jgi:DNA-binding transcriptional regulator GbsR (MarR family)
MEDSIIDKFVDSWGTMGSLWGVSASVARVHGLLIASEKSYCLDEISRKLSMSKSNVSTSLKELRAWGVVRQVVQRGDRREFYTCEPDVWKMLFRIMRERKKREFDPVVAGVRETVSEAADNSKDVAVERLKQMERMLATFDHLAERLLAGESQARALISLLGGTRKKR